MKSTLCLLSCALQSACGCFPLKSVRAISGRAHIFPVLHSAVHTQMLRSIEVGEKQGTMSNEVGMHADATRTERGSCYTGVLFVSSRVSFAFFCLPENIRSHCLRGALFCACAHLNLFFFLFSLRHRFLPLLIRRNAKLQPRKTLNNGARYNDDGKQTAK